MTASAHPPTTPSPDFSPAAALDTRIELASWSFAQKDFDAALEHASHVLKEIPCDPRALALTAGCEILQGNVDAGITGLNQAIANAAIDRYENVAAEAFGCIEFCEDRTLEIAWDDFDACIQFLAQPQFGSPDDVAAWQMALERSRARSALALNNAPAAVKSLKRHLRKYPHDVEARFELGRACMLESEWVIAGELFRQVLDSNPDHALSLQMLARITAIGEDFNHAIELAAEALELVPENCKLRLDLAEYHFAHQNYRECLTVMAETTDCDCSRFGILSCRLECYRELREYDAMLDVCEEILSFEQDDRRQDFDLDVGRKIAKAHKVLGVARVDGIDRAELLLEQECEEFARDLSFGIDVASLFRVSGERELARRTIECLEYAYPYEYDVRLARSITEREVGNLNQELLILKQLVAENPERIEAWLHLVDASFKRYQYKEALFYAFRALDFDGTEGLASYKIASAYACIGANHLALAHLKNAIEMNNSFRGMAAADCHFSSLADCKEFNRLTRVRSE